MNNEDIPSHRRLVLPAYRGSESAPLSQSGQQGTESITNDVVPNAGPAFLGGTTAARPSAPSGGRSKRGLFIGVFAGTAAVAVLALGSLRLIGGGGGASSPEAAIEQFLSSVNEEDPAGLLSMIDPNEVETVRDLFDSVGEVDLDASDSSTIEGASQVDELEVDLVINGGDVASAIRGVEYLDRDETLARIEIDDLDIDVKISGIAESDLVDLGVDRNEAADFVDAISDARIELSANQNGIEGYVSSPVGDENFSWWSAVPEVITIKRDGRWYLSLTYSFAEQVRASDGSGVEPRFGEASRLLASQRGGSESEEELFDALLAATEDGGGDDLLDLIDPVEMAVIHDYWNIINRYGDFDWERSAVQFRDQEVEVVSVDGQTALALVAGSAEFSDGESVTYEGGWCLDVLDRYGDTDRVCYDDLIDDGVRSAGLSRYFDGRAFLPERPVLGISERNGRWYISPTATWQMYADAISQQLVSADWADVIAELEN